MKLKAPLMRERKVIFDYFREEKCTKIIITHRISTIKYADFVVVMKEVLDLELIITIR
ncbi:MAG: hypothetical protein MSH08_02880 [Ezakiella sp.]|nr:hypothetical protein [Ezakiella sp.]MDD7472416.1 hypothetical protein [Bacillota bacterium]